jgi:hypothetical protein
MSRGWKSRITKRACSATFGFEELFCSAPLNDREVIWLKLEMCLQNSMIWLVSSLLALGTFCVGFTSLFRSLQVRNMVKTHIFGEC